MLGGGGVIWGAIICIPFWLFFIWLIKIGVLASETLIFVGLTLSAILLFLILNSRFKAKKDKKDWDTFIKNIPDPPNQPQNHREDPSETGTPQ